MASAAGHDAGAQSRQPTEVSHLQQPFLHCFQIRSGRQQVCLHHQAQARYCGFSSGKLLLQGLQWLSQKGMRICILWCSLGQMCCFTPISGQQQVCLHTIRRQLLMNLQQRCFPCRVAVAYAGGLEKLRSSDVGQLVQPNICQLKADGSSDWSVQPLPDTLPRQECKVG